MSDTIARRRVPSTMRRRPWRMIAIVLSLLLLTTTALVAVPAWAEDAAPSGEITALELDVLYDGAVPNDLDPSPDNGIVATNDAVGFQWRVTSLDLADAVFTQTLPAGWRWDPDSLTPIDSTTDLYRASASVSADGRTLSAILTSLVEGNPVHIELGALRAIPTSAAPAGSVHSPVLTAVDGHDTLTASARDIRVVSEPRAELWKQARGANTVPVPHDFDDGRGTVDAYYLDYRLTVDGPQDAFAIGASDEPVAQPLVVRDSFTVTGANPHARFQAELRETSDPGARARFSQDGDTVDVVFDGFRSVPTAWVDLRLWVRSSDLPADGSRLTVRNTVVPAEEWTSESGMPVVVDTTHNTVTRTVERARDDGESAATKSLYLLRDQDAPRDVTEDPAASPGLRPVSGISNSEVAQGSRIVARYAVHAPTTGGLSTGLTDLVAYDFWNPAEQRITQGAQIYVGGVGSAALDPALFRVEYTDGAALADPEDNTWVSTIADAGGVERVRGVRVAYADGVWAHGEPVATSWFVVGVPFDLVGPVHSTATDHATFRYAEEEAGRRASASLTIGGHRIGTTIDASRSAVMSGERIDYAVTPSTSPAPGAHSDVDLDDLSVRTRLAPGLVTVDVAPPPSGWTVSTTGDADSGMTLVHTHDGPWNTSWEPPVFAFSVLTSFLAPPSQALVTSAVIDAKGSVQSLGSRTAVNSVSVQQTTAITEQKTVVGDTLLESGDLAVWHAKWFNTTRSSAGTSYFVDVLPWDGDPRGSAFHGTAAPTAAEITGASANEVTLQYTTADPRLVYAATADDESFGWMAAEGIDLAAIPGITAFRLVVTDFVSTGTDHIGLRVTTRLSDMRAGDHLDNSVNAWLGTGGRLGESNRARVDIVASAVGGRVWLAPGERAIAGADVTLRDEDGAIVAVAATDQDGVYVFDDLRAGTYRTTTDDSTLGAPESAVVVNVHDHDGDLDGDSGPVLVRKGARVLDVDFGYRFDDGGTDPGPGAVVPPVPTPAPSEVVPDGAEGPSRGRGPEQPGILPLTGGAFGLGALGIAAALLTAGAVMNGIHRRRDGSAS